MIKPMPRMSCLIGAIIATSSLLVCNSFAQNYPMKPIRMVVGFPAGGSTDVTTRLVGQKLIESLGQPVIVENRPGASGALAIERVATAPPDGYTLLTMASAYTILPALRAKLPFDLERDLAPISMVAIVTYMLAAHPSVPARNVKELIALAQPRPGVLSFGSAGVGSAAHLMGELFKLMAKVNIMHIPYKGGVESAVATAAGQVDISFGAVTGTLPFLNTGKLNALAVTSLTRAPIMPLVPTLDESGLSGYDRPSWYGVVAPAGLPKEIIQRLAAAIEKGINSSDVKDSLNKQGLEPRTNTPEQFAMFIRNELAQNARLVKLAGMKADY